MMPSHRRGSTLAGAVVLLAALAACGEDDAADSAPNGDASGEGSSYYEGQTVDFVVPYDPGGGFDVYARAIAPYFADCLGAEVVVRNEPGAGGLLATNSTAVASPDENRLQLLNTIGFAAAQIAGAEGVEFDLNELSHVGRISSPPMAVAVGADSDIQSFDDIIGATEPVRFVATGPGSDGYVFATGLAEAYDFPHEVITGFAGSGEARNALVAGNADAMALAFDSLLGAVEAGEVRPVLLVAEEGHEWMPDAPPSAEFEPAGEDGPALLESLIALGATGRSVAGPPGMPEDRVAEAREAFECALSNEELLSEMESQQRPVDYLGGDEYAEQVQQVLDASPEFEAAIKASF